MSSAHTTGVYNVEGSLVAWLVAGIVANAAALAANAPVVYDAPEQAIQTPSYGVFFPGHIQDGAYQGSNVGEGKHGQMNTGAMQVIAYVSRRSANWRAQLNQMVDAVLKTYSSTSSKAVVIRDFYTDPTEPPSTNYKITLINHNRAAEPMIQNPDIEQRGIVILFSWVERV